MTDATPPQADHDVVGIGNAIVDVLAPADDAFLATNDIVKGGMTLIDEPRAETIYSAMADTVEKSGGSAANSIACVTSLGGRGAFIGKVADDALGEAFADDLHAQGVTFATPPLTDGPATGRCLISVTPDAQRSMSTFLGAAGRLRLDDIDDALIAGAAITFFEGYLFEEPNPREAFVKACLAAKGADRRTALTLSDAGVVSRQLDALKRFVPAHVDILLANQTEAEALFGSTDVGAIADAARALCPLTAVTRSEHGSVLIQRDGPIVEIEARAPTALVDTTGAGDAYAAGLLFGLSRGFDLGRAGALGSLAAAEVISHFGARPETGLEALAKDAGLL
ncbi:MAG: adenosine kinase [Pseudomonadota bacterium]